MFGVYGRIAERVSRRAGADTPWAAEAWPRMSDGRLHAAGASDGSQCAGSQEIIVLFLRGFRRITLLAWAARLFGAAAEVKASRPSPPPSSPAAATPSAARIAIIFQDDVTFRSS